MQYNNEKDQQQKRPGREEFKSDVTDAIKASRKGKGKGKGKKQPGVPQIADPNEPNKKPKKPRKSKYDQMSAKEMYTMVKQKRDLILSKKGIPAKLPRGKAALKLICQKIKA